MQLLRPRRRRVKCFPVGEAGRLGLNTLPPLPRPIDIGKIVGSVDRCTDLTPAFLPRVQRDRASRFRSVLRAMQSDIPLPPIDVYQLRREYYVIDGHHRVAASIRLKLVYIDAIVTPVVLPDTSYENRLNNRRVFFSRRTGLQHVDLSEPADYRKVLAIIDDFAASPEAKDLSFSEAARMWYERVYRPLTRLINTSGMLRHFPGETPGDVVLSVYDFAACQTAGHGGNLDVREAVDRFAAMHRPAPLTQRVLKPVSRRIARAVPHVVRER